MSTTRDGVALASAGRVARGGSHHSSSGPRARLRTGEGVRAVTLLRRALRVCLTPASPPLFADLRGSEAQLEFLRISLCTRFFIHLRPVIRGCRSHPGNAVMRLCGFFGTSDGSLSDLTRPKRILAPMHPGYCPECGERVTPYAAGCALCGADLDPKRWQRPVSTRRRLSVRMPGSLRRAIRGRDAVRVRGSL